MPSCNRPAALTTISAVTCGINLGQIVAIIFQRHQPTAPFATEAAMKLKASWDAFLTASDATKAQKTPEFAGFTIPGSEAVYVGENSNDSIDGQGVYVGSNAVKVAGKFLSTPPDIITELRAYQDESAPGLTDGLTGYLITGDRRIVATKYDGGTTLGGIRVSNFNIGSRNLQGFRALDENAFGLTLAPDWDRDLVVVTPSFDPRALLNA